MENIIDPQWLKPEDEKIELTLDGLARSKALLTEQRQLGNPYYKYHGNCTKTFTEAIVQKFWKREWDRVRSMSLPSSNEFAIKDKTLENEISTLITKDKSWKTRSSLVRKFHENTFNCSNRNGCMSPNDAWKALQNDSDLFKKFYHNRLQNSDWFNEKCKLNKEYKDNKPFLLQGFVADFIYAIGLNTSRKAPLVSYFKPQLAKYLIKKYLNQYSEIRDMFSGMSGRLLGALSCGKRYIGSDLNSMVVKESLDMMKFAEPIFNKNNIKCNYSLEVKNAEECIGTFESVLECPPYGLSEQWNGIKTDKDCDYWIDMTLKNIDAQCYVFVVDENIQRYQKFIKEDIENFSHFGTNKELIVVINKEDRIKLI